ncbi:UNVERIFIED_CONTAM: Ankyrin repeat-containing protein NPR4 [Sesamum radiatum]|uniref:Ankyrin repeat-containing protein NPR4 n=1 Tax=Sesamum radiatum TaxID=300843 RepID=A0AAW2NMP0_SESRA
MAVKGVSCAVVKLLLQADRAIVMLPDKFGNTALHIATRKKRAEIVNELLLLRDTNVNALSRDHKTALDIAEGLPLSEETVEIKQCLTHYGIAFAAIFTVPGGDGYNGEAVMVSSVPFKVFFISNAVALFTSLAVVVVQITVVRGEIKSERKVVEVINKLMWLASVCTTVAFIASSYIVVGRRYRWAAVLVTVIGAVTMAGVLGAMTFYVVKSRRIRRVRKGRSIQGVEQTHGDTLKPIRK